MNVIVYNEEARLEECLEHARDFVDEIVVVDQMSTDATPEIAQRLADVFVRDVHHGHAEPSRELAASRSSGDWILILDADEKLSDTLKAELRDLVEGEPDGYWIRKVNLVDGVEVSTVDHYRLVRKSRVRFDPNAHGGANAVSDNVGRYERIGIVHEKSAEEQIYDDARYDQLALEDDEHASSSKRNWLSHNRTLRDHRAARRRSDLEALVPPRAARILVIGDVRIELPGCTLVHVDAVDALDEAESPFDAAVVAFEGDVEASVRAVARRIGAGGVIVATAPAARNRRRMEEFVGAVLAEGTPPDAESAGGATRAGLTGALSAAEFDVRWMSLVRDRWLDPVLLRPDASGVVVESEDFQLKNVPAEVAEELTAEEIVFAAVGRHESGGPECSVVVAALAGADPRRLADSLGEPAPAFGYELVIVYSSPWEVSVAGTASVRVDEGAGLAALWNAGARAAAGELLVFVSADATPAAGWLERLVQSYRRRPDTGAVGSKVLAPDGTIEHAGLVLDRDRIPYRVYQGESGAEPFVNRPRIMPAVAAAGMVTGRADFVDVGGFDETLGDDLADADFCLRLRTRGLPIIYAPDAVVGSTMRSVPGTTDGSGRSYREFSARWSRAVQSDDVVCTADGTDVNWQRARSWRLPRPVATSTLGRRPGELPAVAWTSHFLEQGGYTEEAIAAVEALDDAGLHVVANPVMWGRSTTSRDPKKMERLAALMGRDLPEDFVHVAHIGADRFKRHPAAIRSIGRTMFETDGLPASWRDSCNLMDEVWVPSEHNLHTFTRAGVNASKLHKVPETFDADVFDPGVAPLAIEGVSGFVFLSMFSWLRRKAWDVLLRAWFEEFRAKDDVTLVIKTDTDNAPPGTDCRRDIELFVRDELLRNPGKGPPVVVLDRPFESSEVPRLYRAADAFVLASHGEGWGRPYMEAMAMGLPAIATRWSGNLEFMNDDNSYLVGYRLADGPQEHWMRGQRWAEPSVKGLRRAMRRAYADQTEAAAIGAQAREDVLKSCAPELVAAAVRERLEAADRHPVHVPFVDPALLEQELAPPARRRPKTEGRRICACIVVNDSAPFLPQCLASLQAVGDSVVVVDAGSDEDQEDMASVRNEALDQADGGWVLMVDATHTLDPASVDVVRQLVDEDRFVGYAAREVRQFGLDGAVSAVEQWKAVLFPRYPDLRYVGRVREQLLPQRSDLGFRLVPSQLVVRQHDHRWQRLDPAASARRQLQLLQRSVREEPEQPFHLFNLGVALGQLALHDEAETALRQAIEHAPDRASWVAPAYAALSRTVAAQGEKAKAVKLAKAATKRAPDWAHGWCVLGAAMVDANRPEAAVQAYARALDRAAETWIEGGDADDTEWQVRAGMGRLRLGRGEFAEAADWLRTAVALSPTNAELRVRLAEAYEGLGLIADARTQLESATIVAHAGPEAYVGFSDFFTRRAEDALLRGLAHHAENRALLERIERLRAAKVVT